MWRLATRATGVSLVAPNREARPLPPTLRRRFFRLALQSCAARFPIERIGRDRVRLDVCRAPHTRYPRQPMRWPPHQAAKQLLPATVWLRPTIAGALRSPASSRTRARRMEAAAPEIRRRWVAHALSGAA